MPSTQPRPKLADISAAQRAAVVRRIVGAKPVVPVEVAAFSSSI
jgi:hypothetical protein